jgi:uncharacterized protein (DUF362 family)
MKNIFERIERKLIIKNTFFIKKGVPRIPFLVSDKDFSFISKDPISEMIDSRKEIFKDFGPSTSVLIKISINSHYAYPASTSKKMLESILYLLKDAGVQKICISDCAGLVHIPTRKVVRKKGLDSLKKYGCRLSVFDYGGWSDIPVDGVYFKNITLSDSIFRYDKIINLSNLKSHWMAGFTFSTKSLVGFMHPSQRWELHRDHLQERIAELSLALRPDINIVDARKIFIDGGPSEGKVVKANTILVNSDLLQTDLKSYEVLFRHKQKNGINDLDKDPYKNDFFRHFLKIQGL